MNTNILDYGAKGDGIDVISYAAFISAPSTIESIWAEPILPLSSQSVIVFLPSYILKTLLIVPKIYIFPQQSFVMPRRTYLQISARE